MTHKSYGKYLLVLLLLTSATLGQEASVPKPSAIKQVIRSKQIPLNPKKTIWLDKDAGAVLLDTEVVFRNGLLEMLVCLKQTKEHESILAFDGEAKTVHAGLLALGVEPGTPVSWDPEFRPPSGPVIQITLMWQDEEKKWNRVPAQKWIRSVTRKYHVAELAQLPSGFNLPNDSDLRYDPKHNELLWFGIMNKTSRDQLLRLSADRNYQDAIQKLFSESQIRPMTADWVFAGSDFYVDPDSGERHYLAEDGNLICVANFASATIDVREKSSSDASGLTYEAWEERIPSLGTKVRVELKPVSPTRKESGTESRP